MSLEERNKMLSLTNETHRKDLQMAQEKHAAALVALTAEKEVRVKYGAPRFPGSLLRTKKGSERQSGCIDRIARERN
jgi:hypothetical protein